ncbi:hypothetical protein F511_33915 [Dorcoceras hygrometricum]|uniref:Uncharacterized protein n=1 Tax=Dorcoceras hygrometricum TaxID=472368 RepID=A0A2Z7CSE3_9LAMI|nr:hypothetical protein F511_33915 [Dorcoceras hygrometricum]
MFGAQSPTSPLLPPRNVPLEEENRASLQTNESPSLAPDELLSAPMHTSRNCVSN